MWEDINKTGAAGAVVTRTLIIWTVQHIDENTKRAISQSSSSRSRLTGDPAVPPSPATDVASDDAWEGRYNVFHSFIFLCLPPTRSTRKGKDASEGNVETREGIGMNPRRINEFWFYIWGSPTVSLPPPQVIWTCQSAYYRCLTTYFFVFLKFEILLVFESLGIWYTFIIVSRIQEHMALFYTIL